MTFARLEKYRIGGKVIVRAPSGWSATRRKGGDTDNGTERLNSEAMPE